MTHLSISSNRLCIYLTALLLLILFFLLPAMSAGEPPQVAEEEMRVDPQRASELASNLSLTLRKIQSAGKSPRPVRLIAVSKLKPASDILALHSHTTQSSSSSSSSSSSQQLPPPHLHFGENYLQELQHKASILPSSIKWSFIGALQTNKCVPLAQIPNLWAVSSVDTIKKADALEKGRRGWVESDAGRQVIASSREAEEDRGCLGVFVQVNTSGEESKSGAEPGAETLELCRHILEQSPHLRLRGLMTIGAIARSQASAKAGEGEEDGEENEDFVALRRERDAVQRELGREGLELSMGMSADFEAAIRAGSDEVRVGSGIFGARPPKGG